MKSNAALLGVSTVGVHSCCSSPTEQGMLGGGCAPARPGRDRVSPDPSRPQYGWNSSPSSRTASRRGRRSERSRTMCLGRLEIKLWPSMSHENPFPDLTRASAGGGGEGRCLGSVPAGARF